MFRILTRIQGPHMMHIPVASDPSPLPNMKNGDVQKVNTLMHPLQVSILPASRLSLCNRIATYLG